jgi:thiosulfate/3-mercaptopyruvate sulfurtransferase
MAASYAHPEALVSADWVQEHLNDPKVRIVETDEDALLYVQEHIPGAVEIGWHLHLQDQLKRDYIDASQFEAICSAAGISNETTVVFYGDNSNWWACYAFWAFKLFGHKDCRIMDGGYALWKSQGRPMTKDVPSYPPTQYKVAKADEAAIRAFRDDTLAHARAGKPMIDVRSTDEYTGKKLHMEGYPQEGSLRGGHIPGARSVPWKRAINDDGTFKSADELKALYEGEAGLKPTDDVIAYCRIGERSSHTWFALKYLLGYPHVRNYDGSWTEWGNLVRVPIAVGSEPGRV